MHIVFIKNYDIWLAGRDYVVERTLGARLCEMKVAVPYSVHLDNQAEAKRKSDKAAKLLKEKEARAKETADSKLAKTRSKSIKK